MGERIAIYLTNLGRYNEGCLMGEWVKLPVDKDKLQEVLDRIGINEQYSKLAIHYHLAVGGGLQTQTNGNLPVTTHCTGITHFSPLEENETYRQ